jgi:hypothetical protein
VQSCWKGTQHEASAAAVSNSLVLQPYVWPLPAHVEIFSTEESVMSIIALVAFSTIAATFTRTADTSGPPGLVSSATPRHTMACR